MSLKRWEKLKQVFELKNPWWTYRKDEVQLPSGKQGEYHFVHVNGSSMVVPIIDGRLMLVNQYRYLVDRNSLEFPCGSVKDGATYEDTARLELAEETGYKAKSLLYISEFNPYNGVTDEMCKVYIARELTAVDTKPDETEEFEQVQLTPEEFDEKIRTGEIWDGMTLAAWMLVQDKIKITS